MSGQDMRTLMESLIPVTEEAGCGCGPDCKCGGDCGGDCGDENCPCECNVNESVLSEQEMGMDKFTMAYIEAALWSSSDNADERGGEPLDKNYSMTDIDPETLEKMKADCASFQEQVWDDVSEDITRAGHDFWLTRNGHGAGFWDGDWPDDGTRLTELSKTYGEFDLYVGDDGKIYGSPLSESMDEVELDEVIDESLTERQMWNRIMKIMGNAGDEGLIEDIGNKPDPKHGRVHEFMVGDGIFKVIKEDD